MSRRQTKRLAASLPERGSPSAPGPSTPHGWEAPQRPLPPLLALPDAVLHRQILEKLEFKELCALAQSAASLNAPASVRPARVGVSGGEVTAASSVERKLLVRPQAQP